jgi:hypothetical protein
MDELQMVRELFAEPAPPRPELMASARARLTGAKGAGYGSGVRRRVPMTALAPVAAAAAVTAVAVLVASVQSGAGAPNGSAAGRPGTASGSPARAGQLVSGKYWVQAGTVGNYLRVGQPGDRYVVLEKVAAQQWTWTRQSAQLPSPVISQALSVQPASPADESAWRAAGSPTIWDDTGQDTGVASPQGDTDGVWRPLAAGHGKPVFDDADVGRGSAGFYVFGRQLSARQLLTLTASPAALKQLLLKQFTPGIWNGSFASYLVSALPALMTIPVTAAVRSALYRVLSGLPGVRDLGQVRDVAGQRGIAVAVDGHWSGCGNEISPGGAGSGMRLTFASCGVQQILIVNPATWLPVAEELRYTSLPPGQSWPAPGGLFSYVLFGAGYWTNQDPPVR